MNLRNCGRAMATLAVMACLLVAMWPAGTQAQEGEWEWQLDTGYMLTGVWGSSSSDVFAVGREGILHYDGWSWSDMGADLEAFGVWGSSGSDVFAVGRVILHYDGNEWTPMENPAGEWIMDVWGTNGSDVFAVAGEWDWGLILHYDGDVWEDMTGNLGYALGGVWGTSSDDVFAVGQNGTILHYDGSSWSAMDSGTNIMLNSVWGTSSNDVYAVGDLGTILHYDGEVWEVMSSGWGDFLQGVWGTSANDIFAVGKPGIILHYDGDDWTQMDSGTTLGVTAIWGSSGSDVFAMAGSWEGPGAILHYGEPVTSVSVDIKPGSHRNSIMCNNENAVIAVAILTDQQFDATTVDHTTVTFEGASEIHVDRDSGEAIRHEDDVDGDGDTDLLFHFRLGDTRLTCESTTGTLRGQTYDAQAIGGTDTVDMIDSGPFESPLAHDGQ